jgi:hypothetical protein
VVKDKGPAEPFGISPIIRGSHKFSETPIAHGLRVDQKVPDSDAPKVTFPVVRINRIGSTTEMEAASNCSRRIQDNNVHTLGCD